MGERGREGWRERERIFDLTLTHDNDTFVHSSARRIVIQREFTNSDFLHAISPLHVPLTTITHHTTPMLIGGQLLKMFPNRH